MGKPKILKPKEDRVKEGISLLKQLREAGVSDQYVGFVELKERISNWVAGEEGWEGTISFVAYGRVAEVELPKWNNRAAGMNFKVKRAY